MKKEVVVQTKLLGNLGIQMDNTQHKMTKVDNKLKELLAKSN